MLKTLVIDDEKPTLSMFKLFLSAYGYEVHIAEDGETGLQLFEQVQPDIIFTDIKMPGIDGLEVLRRIRKTKIPSEVIIITGHGDMEKAIEALDMDASDFINKPVERKALNSALNRAEKRIQFAKKMDLSINSSMDNNHFKLFLGGKLSDKFRNSLMEIISSEDLDQASVASIIFNESFSINRTGISLLIDIINKIKNAGLSVCLENLSYNYIRVFQMAGIHKIADLKEAPDDD